MAAREHSSQKKMERLRLINRLTKSTLCDIVRNNKLGAFSTRSKDELTVIVANSHLTERNVMEWIEFERMQRDGNKKNSKRRREEQEAVNIAASKKYVVGDHVTWLLTDQTRWFGIIIEFNHTKVKILTVANENGIPNWDREGCTVTHECVHLQHYGK